MSYVKPADLVTALTDAGEYKIFMSTRDTLIRAFMAGAILSLAAAFAVTMTVQTGSPLIGALLFPVGFVMLYLLGYDLLTGVFVLAPLAWLDKRPGVTTKGVLRNWGLVFTGNFAGALVVALLMGVVFTFGFATEPNEVGKAIGHIGENRTLGYAEYGLAGWLTIFVRGVLCNWMVSTGVVGAMIATDVPGKVIAMWMPTTLVITTAIGWRNWIERADAAGLAEGLLASLTDTRIVVRGAKAHGASLASGLKPALVTDHETMAELTQKLIDAGVDNEHIAIQHHGANDASVTAALAASAWVDAARERGFLTRLLEFDIDDRLLLAAIGPVTAAPLIAAGFSPAVPDRNRLGSLIRSMTQHLTAHPEPTPTTSGLLRVHASAATLDADLLPTTPAGLEVLRLLASKPGHVFSRHDVLEVLPNNSTDPHAAEVTIARMRRAMGESCPVKTVTKRGYQLSLSAHAI